MKTAELRKTVREASDTELERLLSEMRKDLFQFRYQRSTKQLEKPHRIRETRKQIARILQAMSQRKSRQEARG